MCTSPMIYDRLRGKLINHDPAQLEYYLKQPTAYSLAPCHQCVQCRMQYSRNWANRLMMEAESNNYKDCWFVTLTYDGEHLPISESINLETGELITGATLHKPDLQAFIKRLRRHYEYHHNVTGIRFFAVGEYGSQTHRPHYHAAIYGMPQPDDLTVKFNNKMGQPIFVSQTFSEIWGNGICSLAKLEWQSAAYIARYILKKQTGKTAEWYYNSLGGIQPEYSVMSRMPGIGQRWYENHIDSIYPADECIITGKGGKATKVKPPRYFDDMYSGEWPKKMRHLCKDATDEELATIQASDDYINMIAANTDRQNQYNAIKQHRQELATAAMQLKLSRTSNSAWEALKAEAEAQAMRAKTLVRPFEGEL